MSNFIILHTVGTPAEEIAVNPETIEVIRTFGQGSQLKFMDGSTIGVIEIPLQVLKLVKA